jgi:hypothetical protein
MSSFGASFFSFLMMMLFMTAGCRKREASEVMPAFEMLTADETGLHFTNALSPGVDLNIFHYMYFYNGGGVAVADFNKDNFQDIYFTGNQQPNVLFLNKGNLTFTDVSKISNTSGEGSWSTGVTVTDINNDGWLDIYVNQVGDFRNLHGKNRLYIWKSLTEDGVPVFEESAAAYGLDLTGFGTQAGFFDYDQDGDLDLFQLNHSVHHNGTFGQRKDFAGTFHPTAGDRLFRNDNGKFVDVTSASGILGTVVGYGLGVAFSDVNNDGWTDIYVANDFHENDYLYINQQDGTFKESLNDMLRHTSRYSMGVDIADINNDGHGEILTLDMHPEDPYILKSSLGEDDYGLYLFKLTYGYNSQYARNTLQLNNKDLTFSEIGIYAGIHATDWSWAPLFMDFDHDGYKDLFVSNGIPSRMNDIDYVNYASHDDLHWKIQMDEMEKTDLAVEKKIPEIKLINKFYRNNRDLTFEDISSGISNSLPSFSNGAAYADFDNDGDLDIVVNNIHDQVFLYKNSISELAGDQHHYISFHLNGPPGNPMAIGAKVIAFKKNETLYAEQFPVRGYQSFVSPVLHLGLGGIQALDSVILIWPDLTYQKISLDSIDHTLTLHYHKGLPSYVTHPAASGKPPYADITEKAGIHFVHEENEFVEFNREQLIPHMTSSEGPALAIGDFNNDGLEDFFIGSSKRKKSALYAQTSEGKFRDVTGPSIRNDSVFEDVDAVFADVENDGNLDLIVASGGNEYAGTSVPLTQRVYKNTGNGIFIKDTNALPEIYMTAGCVAIHDFNNDGFQDIFFGGRAVPWNYGRIPSSYLLINDGKGKFSDVTSRYAKELSSTGMVKDALWEDMDHNGTKDLLVAVEWGPLQIFYQQQDLTFRHHSITGTSGWWNFIRPFDFDNDGDMDLVAGNLGQNAKLKASTNKPVKLFVNDFDDNDQVEQIMTYYLGDQEIVFPTYREFMRQLPSLKKKFLLAKDFARASLTDLVGEDKVENSEMLSVEQFANSYFENVDNKGNFRHQPLPPALQFSSLHASALIDMNNDGWKDILLAGNYYDSNIELGRYDADYGSVLLNSSHGLIHGVLKKLSFDGQVRKIEPIRIGVKNCYLVAFNNGPLRLITFN